MKTYVGSKATSVGFVGNKMALKDFLHGLQFSPVNYHLFNDPHSYQSTSPLHSLDGLHDQPTTKENYSYYTVKDLQYGLYPFNP